jgi:hypothetical protein
MMHLWTEIPENLSLLTHLLFGFVAYFYTVNTAHLKNEILMKNQPGDLLVNVEEAYSKPLLDQFLLWTERE